MDRLKKLADLPRAWIWGNSGTSRARVQAPELPAFVCVGRPEGGC